MSIKRSLAWMGIAQAIGFIAQFTASIVLAHYLSPQDMGVFGIGLATVAVLALLQNFGLQPLIVREAVLTPEIRATAFTVNMIISIIQSAATLLLAFVGGSFLRHEGVKHVLLVLAITPLFGIFSFLPGAELERHARFKSTAIITLLTNLLGAGAQIMFAVLGYGYMSLAYAQVIGLGALALSFIAVGREYFSCRVGLSEWKRICHFGVQMFAYSAIVSSAQRACEIMLGRVAGLASLGLYNRASGITNMLWGNIHYLASRVVLVDFATLNRSGTPLKARYMHTVAMITATLWPAFAGLAVLAGPFISIVYGRQWISAAVPLTFLCVASMIQVSMTMTWELFAVTGNTGAQTRVELVRNAISVPLFIAACFVGIRAVAFTRIIDAMLAFLLYRPHVDRMTSTKLSEMREIYAQSAIVTIAAIAPAMGLIFIFRSRAQDLLPVTLAVLSGILLWACALMLMRHPLAREGSRAIASGWLAVLRRYKSPSEDPELG